MSDWWSYTLSDLQIFSARTYARLLEVYNAGIWPAQIAALALGLLLLWLSRRPGPAAGRTIAGILAAAWLWIAVAFHLVRYSSIHWAGRYFAAAFALEAARWLWSGVRGRLSFGPPAGGWRRVGLGVVLFALVFQPLAGRLLGRGWRETELFGVAPDPTAVATIGIVLAASGRVRWSLLPIPAAWCAISGATMLATGTPGAWLTPAAAAAALALALVRTVRRGACQSQSQSQSPSPGPSP